ncbi:hypothetical protein EMQ25_03315 [Arsenicitalea aurantiaca]|uniref:Uncharacterized protein n=1 Tax=Arsenicitalea aurantiaca TaxID=1783274 RepID=A0A433XLN0_9HYPH|nr:hypothetical protein [Arsenicitalea aurantiaca]RUT34996.1 hypothetical protein EMQ25_03315 [Arsenicitalea aurantiaca]
MHLSLKSRRKPTVTATIISFSLTLVAASIATLVGVVPAHAAPAVEGVDAEVLLLVVPLCALVFAIMFEVARIALRGPIGAMPLQVQSIRHWRGQRPDQ